MKNRILLCGAIGAIGMTTQAFAGDSSVTLYGVIDESIQYIHNVGGEHYQLGLQSSNWYTNRWGIKGNEDLGGGLSTVFRLESEFDLNTGKADGIFNRQSYVGLSSKRWGTLTVGKQLDIMQDMVVPVQGDNFLEYFTAPGDIDLADGSTLISNAVQWASPVWNGLQMEAQYSFGGVAGSMSSGSTASIAGLYTGQALTLAAGFFHADNGNPVFSGRGINSTNNGMFGTPVNSHYASASKINVARTGASYAIGPVTFGGYYSYSEYLPDGYSTFSNAERFNNGEVWAYWQVTTAVGLEAGYDYLKSHGDSSATYNQFSLASDYSLSKRTRLYATAALTHATGSNGAGPAQAVIADSWGWEGGNSKQALFVLGIQHKF
ncbi:porin [Paraburkholderia acidipaludis]|uniref:porin n=1 Tax=Paraburkholderia acidipaludis TaxID=660537 RepID=UPI000485E8E8|nr:porin [Paraburkholderia acidipaludis]